MRFQIGLFVGLAFSFITAEAQTLIDPLVMVYSRNQRVERFLGRGAVVGENRIFYAGIIADGEDKALIVRYTVRVVTGRDALNVSSRETSVTVKKQEGGLWLLEGCVPTEAKPILFSEQSINGPVRWLAGGNPMIPSYTLGNLKDRLETSDVLVFDKEYHLVGAVKDTHFIPAADIKKFAALQ